MINTLPLEEKLRARALERMVEASDEMRREIELNAPRDTGQLSVAPVTSSEVSERLVVSHVTVSRDSPDGFDVARAQDEGTGVYAGRGRIYPTDHLYLKFFSTKIGRIIFTKSVAGTPATHYFSNAVDRWKDRLAEAFSR